MQAQVLRLLNEVDMSPNPAQASLRAVSKSAGVASAQRSGNSKALIRYQGRKMSLKKVVLNPMYTKP